MKITDYFDNQKPQCARIIQFQVKKCYYSLFVLNVPLLAVSQQDYHAYP